MGKTERFGFVHGGGGGASSSRFPKRRRSSRRDLDESEFFEEEEVPTVERQAPEQETRATDSGGGGGGGKGNRTGDLLKHFNNGPVTVTLNDPEVLDCPVCYEPLNIPVYQCGNGHVVCHRCCCDLMNKCPSCRLPNGHSRSTAMEKVIESIQVACENADYGCKEKMSYSEKYDHGRACHYTPCSCPLAACNFVGSFHQIYQHFRGVHKHAAEEFVYDKVLRITLSVHHDLIILQEEKNGDLFILNNSTEPDGYRISVNCIAPSCKGGVVYSIVAKSGGAVYEFNSCTKSIQNWDENNPPSVASLLVPSDFFGSYGQLHLGVRIQHPRKAYYCEFERKRRIEIFLVMIYGLPLANLIESPKISKVRREIALVGRTCHPVRAGISSLSCGTGLKCRNGQVACSSCYSKINYTRSLLRQPIDTGNRISFPVNPIPHDPCPSLSPAHRSGRLNVVVVANKESYRLLAGDHLVLVAEQTSSICSLVRRLTLRPGYNGQLKLDICIWRSVTSSYPSRERNILDIFY
ncbi:E3 ubiquitin-protein ligase SINA-like 10 [Citrus sinensis]|uniref:E3 ubiquitin-protein ligase SINA-like 10 n=1 Tax=Citrus sinensis TaxID=2711 RepID=A0ACB8K306_CITSI|nr:E3 ubiquitin-protein ligase SINA-like 10 [Citrus sinensis]